MSPSPRQFSGIYLELEQELESLSDSQFLILRPGRNNPNSGFLILTNGHSSSSGGAHQKAAELCEVVVGLVEDPAGGVEVQLDLVAGRQVREAHLSRHAVAVIVGVVLVVDAGDLRAVPTGDKCRKIGFPGKRILC